MDNVEIQQAIADFGVDAKVDTQALADYIEQAQKEKEKHNGWTNFSTWLVTDELIGDIADNVVTNKLQFPSVDELGNYLAQQVGDYMTVNTEAMSDENVRALTAIRNYANNFLSTVNWPEIAQSIVEAHPEVIA